MKQPQPPSNAVQLSSLVTEHCATKGYVVVGPETTKQGYVNFEVSIDDKGPAVGISFNGEVFRLHFPAGYSWTEFAQAPEDRFETLEAVLAFLDSYASSATHEVEVKRRLRRPRMELHVEKWSRIAATRLE